MSVFLAVRNCFRLSNHFVIPAILISGFSFRIIGINIGLPDSPDPREALIARDVLNLIHFTAPPQIYNWPGTAWFYIIAAAGKLLSLTGLAINRSPRNPIGTRHQRSVVYSDTLVHLPHRHSLFQQTYQVRLPQDYSLWRCYMPRMNRVLHLLTSPATFCVTLFLYLVTRERSSSGAPTLQTAVWLGVIAGVGFAVKFTTVFAGFSLLVFTISEDFPPRGRCGLKPHLPRELRNS